MLFPIVIFNDVIRLELERGLLKDLRRQLSNYKSRSRKVIVYLGKHWWIWLLEHELLLLSAFTFQQISELLFWIYLKNTDLIWKIIKIMRNTQGNMKKIYIFGKLALYFFLTILNHIKSTFFKSHSNGCFWLENNGDVYSIAI